jgi:uncharacterized membrane protein YraQ (UPF0718 family)
VIAELALIAVAFALSLCSAADAFVAASFGAFGTAPQLAFLAFGPIADAKLTVLYSATFRRSFAARVLVVAFPVVIVAALLAAQVIGWRLCRTGEGHRRGVVGALLLCALADGHL